MSAGDVVAFSALQRGGAEQRTPLGQLADASRAAAGWGLGSDLGEMNKAIRITAATAPKRIIARPNRRALASEPGVGLGSGKG
jgi:hypothetical protein